MKGRVLKQFWPSGAICNIFFFRPNETRAYEAFGFSEDGKERVEYKMAFIENDELLAFDDKNGWAWKILTESQLSEGRDLHQTAECSICGHRNCLHIDQAQSRLHRLGRAPFIL